MNRPVFIMVIGYIIGIIWGLYLKKSIVPFYIFLILMYIIIKLPYSKKEFKIISIKRYFKYLKFIFKNNIIFIIIISSFISNLIVEYQEKKYNNMFKNGQEVEMIAIIVSNEQKRQYYNRYKVKVKGQYLYINIDKNIQLQYGDKIHIKGEFQEPSEARNFKGFDYKQYLKTMKIYGSIKISSIEILDRKCGNKILQISNAVFLKIKSNIEETFGENISGIMLGVMLGYTEQIEDDIKEAFSTSNIAHVLAISGMHISYIINLVINSSKKIIGKKNSKIMASIVLYIYMFITGFSVSVVRAVIMGILLCMSFVFYRKSDTINNISISALIILVNNPYSLFSLSFQLSYGGTLGIIYFQPVIDKIIKKINIKNRKWKYIFLRVQKKCEKLINIISISLSAQIVIAPIIIVNFNSLSISFIVTNLLLSFIIGIIVMGGFIQILVSFVSLRLGKIIASIIEIPIYMLLAISKINFANFKVITPDLYQIILYYIMIIVFRYFYIIFHSKKCSVTQRRIKNTMHLIKYKLHPYFKKIYCTILICILLLNITSRFSKKLNIHFIDQTTPNMIQRISGIFERKPLISIGI